MEMKWGKANMNNCSKCFESLLLFSVQPSKWHAPNQVVPPTHPFTQNIVFMVQSGCTTTNYFTVVKFERHLQSYVTVAPNSS